MATFDLSSLLIDFTQAPAGVKVIDHFPELTPYPEFINAFDNEIKIAILIADIESPFLKIKDNESRLKAIFEFLDIGLMNLKTKELFNSVLNYTHGRVIDACCRYIQIQNNHDFASWWSLNLAFYELQKQSVKTREANEDVTKFVKGKTETSKEMDRIATMLKDYEARLFKDTKMKQKMVEQQLKKISFFPEKMAEDFPGF